MDTLNNRDLDNQSFIELKDISVTFKSKQGIEVNAVSNFSLKIKKGEILGIIGSSGAGKSTIARNINLLERPSQGDVYFKGEKITNYKGKELRQIRQKMGMIYQHFNLISRATVRDNIAFNLLASNYEKDKIDSRVDQLLDLVGLKDKKNSYPSQLSGGQKQRVAIARSLSNNPEVLICDEATSALDPETAQEIVKLIKDINSKLKLTVVFITHQMEVAKDLFDRIAVMDSGKLIEVNDSYSIFANQENEETKLLIDKVTSLKIPKTVLKNNNKAFYQITYVGEKAYLPIISNTIKTFDVDISIIHGKIEYINDKPFGILIITISGHKETEAINYLKENTSNFTLIQGATNE
ncbi:MAG: ATP-binding cassette domain-containing protein [Sphaerochaetaceae bacterium]|nr:ATP-binding cassette domain-containing protein [Sphaerochaetaceae bacterium]